MPLPAFTSLVKGGDSTVLFQHPEWLASASRQPLVSILRNISRLYAVTAGAGSIGTTPQGRGAFDIEPGGPPAILQGNAGRRVVCRKLNEAIILIRDVYILGTYHVHGYLGSPRAAGLVVLHPTELRICGQKVSGETRRKNIGARKSFLSYVCHIDLHVADSHRLGLVHRAGQDPSSSLCRPCSDFTCRPLLFLSWDMPTQ